MAKRVTAAGTVEGPWVLPDGWRWARLGDVAQVIAGQSPPSAQVNKDAKGLPFFQGKAEFGAERPVARNWCNSPPKIAVADDVLISVRAPVGPTNYAPERCGIGRGLAAIRPNAMSPRYLRYWLAATGHMLRAQATGTTFEAITGDVLRNHAVPVPPDETDLTIVVRIDELFAEIDDGEAALARARDDLVTWRKALLKAAVTGELTADWRAANPAAEIGADLLERILADRRNLWDRSPTNMGKAYKAPLSVNVAGLEDLPVTWVWTNVDAILVGGIQNGLYLPQSAYGAGHPILRIDDFQAGVARKSDELRLVNADIQTTETYALKAGDLVINRVNSLTHLAKSFLVRPRHIPALFESNMMRMVPSKTINLDYLEYYISSEIGRSRLCCNAKAAVNQASVNQTDVRTTPIPLPPLDEQNEIAAVVGRLMAEAEAGADDLATMTSSVSALRQSILAAAFRGELA